MSTSLRLQGKNTVEVRKAEGTLPSHVVHRRRAAIASWACGFFIALWLLGISIAVPLTTLLYLKLGAHEKWAISLVLAAGAWLLCYGLFVHTLEIPFPDGALSPGFD